MLPLLASWVFVGCALAGDLSSASIQVPQGVSRRWIGPEFYGNRLQDWRLADGRIQCVESRPAKPMRVLHLLTTEVSSRPGTVRAEVRMRPVEKGAANPASLAGFLIGSGSPEIDYRLTALVHHRPAPDGGLVVAVDGTGEITFRDFETNVQGGNWGITGELDEGELAELPASRSERSAATPSEWSLVVSAAPGDGDLYTVTAEVRDPASGDVVHRAELDRVSPRLIDGGIGLCSHLGPRGSAAGFEFDGLDVGGSKLDYYPERGFGPIVATQYTATDEAIQITAQMAALGPEDTQTATLWISDDVSIEARLDPDARTFEFRVPLGSPELRQRDLRFRVDYDLAVGAGQTRRHEWPGVVRAAPAADRPVTVAAFTGNKHFTGGIRWNPDGVWFPHTDIVRHVRWHRPDLLFFSGDQIYEGDLTGVQRKPVDAAILDYLDKWYRWCWAFGELARDRPCICIPDDHDVYHGNIWGAGGRHAARQDDGGYTMPARFVNMVQRTQTSHLPDPVDPAPCEQDIGVYFTRYELGAVDFAILEDRKFKSSPSAVCDDGECRNGWFQNPDYDPVTQADVEGAELLGARQLAFLDAWAERGEKMKCVLSQTIFANVATLPSGAKSGAVLPRLAYPKPGEYPAGERLAADADSNGWPQSGRNEALRRMRKAGAFHIAGDQHLGSLIRYGVDAWGDAGYAFCVPSIANTWPRRWFPAAPGGNRAPTSPRYTGDFRDGFGNLMTVVAVSNPRDGAHQPKALHDRAPGYGIVRFRPEDGRIDIECWPRWSDPSDLGAEQYEGWPVTIEHSANRGR